MRVLMYKAEEKGIQLSNSFCDSKLSNVLIGDPYRLNQVLLNLISNAIKFTAKGSVDVSCRVLSETEDSQLVEACVADTGIGMDEEFVDKLFDKFSQEYESVSRKFGGTGLGMSICKELIELMGGEITVESKKNIGTVVKFMIKFQKGTIEDLPVQMASHISGSFLKGKKILVVDDNDMNRLVAATLLQEFEANILEAGNGEEALKLIQEHEPSLVLMDIQMPVMNGFEATRVLRATGNQVPVIALTANAINGEQDVCIEAGMNDYIAKPFNEETFLSKIAKALHADVEIKQSPVIAAAKKTAPLYDLAAMESISRGNQAFIEKMLGLFCDQSPNLAGQILASYEAGDLEAMSAIAHKMKPSIDNLNILSLKQVIRTIEKAGKERNDFTDLPLLIAELNTVIAAVVAHIKKTSLTTTSDSA